MRDKLVSRKCKPCEVGAKPLKGEQVAEQARELGGKWRIIEDHHLEKDFRFKDFKEALAFVNRVGEIAEQEGHHPEICFTWGKARLKIWTHKVDGLTENDFILAAKADRAT